MALRQDQYETLNQHIENTPELNAFPNNEDGAQGIADLLNLQAVPDFTVWKTLVNKSSVGATFDGSELASLTTAESNRLQTFAQWSALAIDPSDPDVRFLFDDVFSGAGGTVTRPALAELWKRLSNEVEKLFAIGTGSDPDPATMDFEGNISRQDVSIARNL